MNINLILLNVLYDPRSADVRDYGREGDERFARASSQRGTSGAIRRANVVDEVIELMPQNGAWVEKGGTMSAGTDSFGLAGGRKALHASSAAATYDHKGKVRSSQDKGLRINITA
jgi:hypothetical protein